jgi:hypothetical protein
MSILDFGLGLAGLPEATIKDLDAHLPHLARISAAAKEAEPLISQLMPIMNKAWPDIVSVTPLIQELIAFAKQKENES